MCVKAAIGLCYQCNYSISHYEHRLTNADSTILVAMRSALLPSQNSTQALQRSMDLTLDQFPPQLPELPFVPEWELWGEEPVISLCEVRIEFRPQVPRMCFEIVT